MIDYNTLSKEVIKEVNSKIDYSIEVNDKYIEDLISSVVLNDSKLDFEFDEKIKLINHTFNSMRRYGILQPLIEDDSISEIMINGCQGIFVEKSGKIEELETVFESEEKLMQVIQGIVSKVNRTINESNPIVDARLMDGSRINAVIPPVSLVGPTLTIRKFFKDSIDMEDLINWKSISREAGDFVKDLVLDRKNIIVSGGTGSGKTTFLNIISNFIEKDERIITIEDSAELNLREVRNLITLEARNENVEGNNEISIRDLIKASLRMRPDRIIVGEVRGSEAIDMLQAMNTGHEGSLSTIHSNSARDTLIRLETMVLLEREIPLHAIRSQIFSAVDYIVHLGRMRDKSRKVVEIVKLVDYKNGEFVFRDVFKYDSTRNELIRK
ncbi:MAG: CpaF family protein [Firmicutes bacterium]|jgi:pilus assembly protein CpaF|nr:CpaF family protein [Bacillota bacterium]